MPTRSARGEGHNLGAYVPKRGITMVTKTVSKKLITSFGEFQGVLTWNFANGEVLEFDAGVSVEIAGTLSQVQRAAMLHGFKQKISDAGAMSCDQTTGLSPAPEERIARMRRVAERLASGEWELPRVGGTGGGDTLLARALSEAFSKPLDVIRPWLKGKTAPERAALKADKKVAKIIARMEAESAKGTDTSGLMAELGELG